ncbi:MAG: Nif3-like dinuclear metal center hexameric protein [bacterium]
MTAGEIIKYIEKWAPPGTALERDNAGLQVGAFDEEIKKVFLCLELSKKALDEALKNNCNFIFTHHPLIFKPLKNLNFTQDEKSSLIKTVIKNNIVVYSAHTNFDNANDGVSFQLAKVLGLQKIKFLSNLEANQFKVIVFVPENAIDKVAEAMFNAGAGVIGEYEKCSYRSNGQGTFLGSNKTNPAAGEKEKFEKVSEIRLEILVDAWKLNSVIREMLKVHPYEEPAHDIYQLKNKNVNYGTGAIGEFEKALPVKDFLKLVCERLKTNTIRYCNGKKKSIRKVAVCGGSGAEYISEAIKQDADAFITADVKYHPFQDAEDKILLIDAGHYETEVHSLSAVRTKLEKYFSGRDQKIKILQYTGTTNPVKFYNN